MNFSALLSFATNILTNGSNSSVFSRFIGGSIYSTLGNVGNFIMSLLYTVTKYLLYFVDLIYSYIQKLCGLDMSLESLDAMMSGESDIVFNLLVSGRDFVTMIIRNLIVLAIVIIIVFAIVAIIKGQYDAVKKGQETSPGEVIKTTVKAFILLLVTPFIAIGGILFSDLVLQTLYNATNVSGAMSLGTQVFMTASSSANAYRIYAQNDQRIPITFDGTKNAQISEYFSSHQITDGFVKYLQETKNANSEYNPIYATYMSFITSHFSKFSEMNDIIYSTEAVEETRKLYDKFYDYYVQDESEAPMPFADLRRIESYSEFYYVMADVVDFCIKTASPVYFKTVDQVLDSVYLLPDGVDKDSIFNLMVQQYGIEFYQNYDSGTKMATDRVYVDGADDYNLKKNLIRIITFNSDYLSVSDGGDPEIKMQIPVMHIRGETDELLGAKFIVATQTTARNSEDGSYSYYFEPFVNGTRVNGTVEFKSDYIRNGNIIVAKGIFAESKYPTAMRIAKGQNQSGDTVDSIEFYREDISAQAEGQMEDYLSVHIDDPNKGLFGKLIKFISALFNPEELVPEIDINFDAMVLDYVKTDATMPVDTLVDARLRIGYFMPYNPQMASPSIVKNMGLAFTDLYAAAKLNFLLLVMGSFLLLRVSFSAISSLIERAYELFLLFITYPAACVTIPIDGGNAYNTWLKGYIARIFRTYGFILGINFVLLLFPVIEKIEFFTQEEIGTSKIIRRVGALFFSVLTIRQITSLMNLAVAVMFELVAFTLIETIPDVISTIVSGKESALQLKDNNVFTKIKNTSVKFGLVVGKVVMPPLKIGEYILSSKKHKQQMRSELKMKMKDKMSQAGLGALTNPQNFIPGKALLTEAQYKQGQKAADAQQKQAEKDLFKALDDPNSSTKDVKKALADYEKAAVQRTNTTKKKWKCQVNESHKFTEAELRRERRKLEDAEKKAVENGEKIDDSIFNEPPNRCPTCWSNGDHGALLEEINKSGGDKGGGGDNGGGSGGGSGGGGK